MDADSPVFWISPGKSFVAIVISVLFYISILSLIFWTAVFLPNLMEFLATPWVGFFFYGVSLFLLLLSGFFRRRVKNMRAVIFVNGEVEVWSSAIARNRFPISALKRVYLKTARYLAPDTAGSSWRIPVYYFEDTEGNILTWLNTLMYPSKDILAFLERIKRQAPHISVVEDGPR